MEEKIGEGKVYNWGIAGCGKISKDFATCLLKHSRSKVFACAARKQDEANEFAKLYDIDANNAYDNYKKLAEDKNVDIVYVGTIHITHKEIVCMCLNHNKHVVCEKPMGINSKEVSEMIECARKNKKLLLEGMWTRFFPAFDQIREWINDDCIGSIVSYQGNFSTKMAPYEQSPRLWDKSLAGGSILDIGVYLVPPIVMCFGKQLPKNFKAMGIIDEKHGVDSVASAIMTFNDTQSAVIDCSMITNGTREFNIMGTKGRIRVENPSHSPEQVTLFLYENRTHINQVITKKFPLPKGFKYGFNFNNSQGLYYEIDHVVSALDQNLLECKQYDLEETLIVHQIMDEWRKQVGIQYKQDQ